MFLVFCAKSALDRFVNKIVSSEVKFHLQKYKPGCAFWTCGVNDEFFIEVAKETAVTVNIEHYKQMFKDF